MTKQQLPHVTTAQSESRREASTYEQCTDQELINHAVASGANSNAAFSALIRRHRPWLLRRCNTVLRNRHDAEDAMQEISIRVFRALGQYSGTASFRAWLYTIADNTCRTLMATRRRYVVEDDMEALLASTDQGTASDDHVSDLVTKDTIGQVLRSLPEVAREVIRLRFFEDQQLNDMAQKMDLNLSATKMRLYRALEQFKDQYQLQSG